MNNETHQNEMQINIGKGVPGILLFNVEIRKQSYMWKGGTVQLIWIKVDFIVFM